MGKGMCRTVSSGVIDKSSRIHQVSPRSRIIMKGNQKLTEHGVITDITEHKHAGRGVDATKDICWRELPLQPTSSDRGGILNSQINETLELLGAVAGADRVYISRDSSLGYQANILMGRRLMATEITIQLRRNKFRSKSCCNESVARDASVGHPIKGLRREFPASERKILG